MKVYRMPGAGVAVGTGVGTLAATGADVTWWAVAGVALLVSGILLLRRSRRRHAHHDG
ncbi:LPXTG-motif cell wall anchor domain-containing protein [Actinosynnema pretiosum]|nr:LPXTG-motif cell wall anchor domain-containing protein [Actinosynnema pretiosum]